MDVGGTPGADGASVELVLLDELDFSWPKRVARFTILKAGTAGRDIVESRAGGRGVETVLCGTSVGGAVNTDARGDCIGDTAGDGDLLAIEEESRLARAWVRCI